MREVDDGSAELLDGDEVLAEARAEYRAALAWYAAHSLDAADGFADAIATASGGSASC